VIDQLRRIPCEGENLDLPTLTIEIVRGQQGIVKTLTGFASKLITRRRARPLAVIALTGGS
jgi:hypothetical protein